MRKWTVLFIIATVVIIAGYDMYAIFVDGKEASISQVIIDWSYQYPSLTFLMGFVMGHLFWRMPDRKKPE